MKIKQWMKKENVPESLIKSGKFVVAISVDSQEMYDAIVNSQNNLIYLREVNDLDQEVDEKESKIFIIKTTSWKRMTTKNLWLSNHKKDSPPEIKHVAEKQEE